VGVERERREFAREIAQELVRAQREERARDHAARVRRQLVEIEWDAQRASRQLGLVVVLFLVVSSVFWAPWLMSMIVR
jgi:uncharacterized membrane protein